MCNISRYELFFFVKLLVKKMNPSVLSEDILIFSSHTLYTANFLQKTSDWTIACYRRFFSSLTDRAGHWVCPVSTIPLVKPSTTSDHILMHSTGWEESITVTELCYMIANILWWILNCLNQGLLITFFFIVPIYCLIYKVIITILLSR